MTAEIWAVSTVQEVQMLAGLADPSPRWLVFADGEHVNTESDAMIAEICASSPHAPMRGFTQERVASGFKENLLSFGCRNGNVFHLPRGARVLAEVWRPGDALGPQRQGGHPKDLHAAVDGVRGSPGGRAAFGRILACANW